MNIIGNGTPTTITAHLTSPIVGMDRIMLDGPVAWAWVVLAKGQGRTVPAITPTFAPDFPLPFCRWESNGTWGWCVSEGTEDVVSWTTAQIRRKPNVTAMARYTTDKKHHAGLGPFKARDVAIPGRVVKTVTWEALVTDTDELGRLLREVTNLSARWRNGFGQVSKWEMCRSADRDGWQARPLPSADGTREIPIRPPYWHPTRRTLCAPSQ